MTETLTRDIIKALSRHYQHNNMPDLQHFFGEVFAVRVQIYDSRGIAQDAQAVVCLRHQELKQMADPVQRPFLCVPIFW